MQRFLNIANLPSIFLSHSRKTIYPFFGNITVSTQLNRLSFFASVDGNVFISFKSHFVPDAPAVVPVHIVSLYGSFLVSIASVFCHHFVLLHSNTCFKVLMTAFGFGSQIHPIAFHKLSAITSDKIGSIIFFKIFIAILAVLV